MEILAVVLSACALVISVFAFCAALLAGTLHDVPAWRRGGRSAQADPAREDEEKAREEVEKSRAMADGFDNIMQYQVMGKDGFGK